MPSANLTSVKALPKRSVRQYALGMMRIDDGDSVTNNTFVSNVTNNDNRVIAWMIINVGANEAPIARIFLPQNGCLRVNGKNIPVDPLIGERTPGLDYYDVSPGEIWCAVEKKEGEEEISAALYKSDKVPADALHKFPVARVPEDLIYGTVTQYVYGLVSVGASSDVLPAPFDPVYDEQGELTGFGPGYIQVGGYTVEVSSGTDTLPTDGFVCVEVDCTEDVSEASFANYTAAELATEQNDLDKIVIPLYKMTSEEDETTGETKPVIAMDMRRMPSTGMLENYLGDEGEGA